jgi:sulfatase modifying factor 1
MFKYLILFFGLFVSCNKSGQKLVTIADIPFGQGFSETQTAKMVWIAGGSFWMGTKSFADAQPVHEVFVDGFWIDEHEVTYDEYTVFVKATGYVTVAERPLNPKDFPAVSQEDLVPGAAVFMPPAHRVLLDNPLQWWTYLPHASWKNPEGSGKPKNGNEPVRQVSFEDALAYAKWVGKRLPTEAEWEFAARAGQNEKSRFYWGDELKPSGKWPANIFQGSFPNSNTLEDGFGGVAPVKQFPPNAYGLYDMVGNVWEWCSDFYRPDYYATSPSKNPQGPAVSYDPDEPSATKRVQRGGSFLCSDQYCTRYMAGGRGKGEVASSGNNVGFRCVKDR